MTTQKALLTAEEFMRLSDQPGRMELIDGELVVMAPASFGHGAIAGRITGPLRQHVKGHDLGEVVTAEASFLLRRNPDRVRVPDVAFVARERLPSTSWDSFLIGPPDLAIEIVSPTDRLTAVRAKAREWLDAGARFVWVLNPRPRTVTVYRPSGEPQVLSERDTLDGEDVVPGFRCPIAELFPRQSG